MPRISFLPSYLTVAVWSLTVALQAGPIVYVSNTSQLGTVDLSTGAFQPIGPDFPDASEGLGFGPSGLLFTMGFDGYLNSVNPGTGVMTSIGPSGLSDCPTPTSPCGRELCECIDKLRMANSWLRIFRIGFTM